MNRETIKIIQEKANSHAVSKRLSFSDKIKNNVVEKILKEVSVAAGDYSKLGIDERQYRLLDDVIDDIVKLGEYDLDMTTNRMLQAINQVNKSSASMIKITPRELPKGFIEQVMNEQIDAMNFSDRIWKNKKKLANELNDIIGEYIGTKELNLEAAARDIARRFDVDTYSATRLLNQEVARVENQVVHETYMRSPTIQLVQFVTMDDERVTEDICRPLHLEVFSKTDPNLPIPPLHIGCRSILRPYHEKMDKYKFY